MARGVHEYYRAIGVRVRAHRLAQGITQEGLGEAVGLQRSSLSNIEGGRQHTPVHTLAAIAQTLRVRLVDLLPDTRLPVSRPPTGLPGATLRHVRQLHNELSRFLASEAEDR